MTVEQKKSAAKIAQDFYLYPYRSKEENAIRGAAWMASWLIGIVAQQSVSPQILGGAYFIFALSLLLEFVPQSKHHFIPRLIHGIFCTLLFIMLLGAVVLSFGGTPAEGVTPNWLYLFLIGAPPYMGWISFIMMLIEVMLAFIEIHKSFYDEKAETERKTEEKRENKRIQFMERLNGPQEGGSA